MQRSPLEFPCDYAVKVLGRSTPDFRARILEVVTARLGPVTEEKISERPSRGGKYVALTCTVHAESREELDGLYRALHATGLVLVAL